MDNNSRTTGTAEGSPTHWSIPPLIIVILLWVGKKFAMGAIAQLCGGPAPYLVLSAGWVSMAFFSLALP